MSRVSYYIKFTFSQSAFGKLLKIALYISVIVVACVISLKVIDSLDRDSEPKFVSSARSLVYETRWATYWGYRYYTHTNSVDTLAPAFRSNGTLEGMTEQGELVMRIYRGGEVRRIQMPLADLLVNDIRRAAELVNSHRRESIAIDYYQFKQDGMDKEQVVVWLRSGQPLNEVLIDQGVASALSTPPTNIVNQLMFKYHLNNLRQR